jgi:hypothetical protein
VKRRVVRGTVARTVLIGAVLLAVAACGYDSSATFNADGSVTVGLKFLFPTSLMQGGSSGSVTGFTPADLTKANAQLAAKYAGAKVVTVTEGDESGAAITVPFKTEKDAFAFMTQPSQLKASGAASGSSTGINLGNTGGLFASANHTTSGQADTYTFTTQPAPVASPSPGSQASPLTNDELASIFTVTFSLTVPNEITSAPGALFTLDRKTATWKLHWLKAETLTATTGPSVALTGLVAGGGANGQSPILPIGVGIVAIIVGFALGKFMPSRTNRSSAVPAMGPAMEPTASAPPVAPPPMQPPPVQTPGAWPGPPPGAPPPANPTGV